jgi:hypothetical protein
MQVTVVQLPDEVRPDFSRMMGGVRLESVSLTLRSKTDRLVLKEASLTLLAGKAAVITGAQYSVVQYSVVQYSAGQCSTVQGSTVQRIAAPIPALNSLHIIHATAFLIYTRLSSRSTWRWQIKPPAPGVAAPHALHGQCGLPATNRCCAGN